MLVRALKRVQFHFGNGRIHMVISTLLARKLSILTALSLSTIIRSKKIRYRTLISYLVGASRRQIPPLCQTRHKTFDTLGVRLSGGLADCAFTLHWLQNYQGVLCETQSGIVVFRNAISSGCKKEIDAELAAHNR